MTAPILDICIPTCNRASIIQECLEHLIPQVEGLPVRIWVSDNASDDATPEVLAALQARWEGLKVVRQPRRLDPDAHFEAVLRLAEAPYVWLHGDGTRVEPGFLPGLVAEAAGSQADALILNGAGRVTGIPSTTYTDRESLLRDLGWHMTQMSAYVYRRELLAGAAFERYRNTRFIQMGILFEAIAHRPFEVRWLSDPVLGGTRQKKWGFWDTEVFQVFGRGWMAFVMSLPATYSLEAKLDCVRAHGVKSGVFSARGFRKWRRRGFYDWKAFSTYRRWLPFLTDVPTWRLGLIALLPLRPLHQVELWAKGRLRDQREA